VCFFFSSRRRHTRLVSDWSSDVCSSDLYIMSGASNDSIEAAAKVAPKNTWYQLYAATDPKIREDMIRRIADAGLDALVLTVDVRSEERRVGKEGRCRWRRSR